MIGLTPQSWGSPLVEYNQCHSPEDGRFCSARGYLGREAARARKLGITLRRQQHPDEYGAFDPTKITTPGFADYGPFGGGTVTMQFPKSRKRFKDEGDYFAPLRHPSRAEDLSVLRHEIGHITDRNYPGEFKSDHPARYLVSGRSVDWPYAREIGAWRAAIRDAPHHRVRWSTVRTGLRSYLQPHPAYRGEFLKTHNLPDSIAAVGRKVDELVDRDIATLKRYARRLRSRRKAA